MTLLHPVQGLHHFAWRCRDAEETRHFYEDILGLPLVHVIKKDTVPSTGEYCPYVHIFFRMGDGSHIAFFDLGDDTAALPSPNTPAWVNHIALRVDSTAALADMKARLQAHGIEVLGITDHDGFIHSIYFFDPNGFRLELTTQLATQPQLEHYADEAHGALAAWTQQRSLQRAQQNRAEARVAEPALVAIDVQPGVTMESQSGLQALRPRIFGAFATPTGGERKVAAIVMHPTSNFMGHYLLAPLAARGIACLGLNSRYAGNDTMLLMETVLQDLGAGVLWLRAQGYQKVVLAGNSGGAALAAFYQSQAESLTATHFVDGLPTHLSPADLPPVDALMLSAAHAGRSRLLAEWLDPSVIDEHDPLATDPAFDLYGGADRPPFTADFVGRFRAAQRARRDRIEAWVWQRLRLLRATPGAPADQTFLVYRTHSDPRFLDLALDANDRPPGSIWGDARTVNYAANAMGRFNTLRSWLSQWSSASQADGPACIARTSVPVLLMTHTADGSTFPSTAALWRDAAAGRLTEVQVRGGNHYLAQQPELVTQSADAMRDWLDGALS